MAYLNFVPDLFLGDVELNRFQSFLNDKGLKKTLLDNTASFGLVRLKSDSALTNGRVEKDVDSQLGQKTIKIGTISAIDIDGNFILQGQVSGIPVPGDGNWYWVKISHLFSPQEVGKVSIDQNGNLIGTDTKFLTTLRGGTDVPSTIQFLDSTYNILEYTVLEVTDDTHAILVYPGLNVNDAEFVSESNLHYQVNGSFTQGVEIDPDNRAPFKYDATLFSLVAESSINVRPTHSQDREFFLARVRVTAGNLIIQDKRTEFWRTNDSDESTSIETIANSLIGIEAIKYENPFNPNDKNIVELAWGMRGSNWSIDSSQNIVTLFGSALGGSFKSVDDFTDGDFNSNRLYTSNGKFSTIVSSVKQGSAINLTVDVLDVDDFSNDGGTTMITQELLVVPNAESIQIAFKTNSASNVDELYSFPINTPVGECLVTAYADPLSYYNVLYRLNNNKKYTDWRPINSGSYFTEDSFKLDGSMVAEADRVVYNYTADATAAFMQVKLSPNSYLRFKQKIDKGDVIGVNTISSVSTNQILELKVGVDKRYQHFTGSITAAGDIVISLSRANAIEGNEFRLHFECSALSLGTHAIKIVDDYSSGSTVVVKSLTQGDAYEMLNRERGIVIDCVFDNLGKWIANQDYSLGQPFQTTMFDGVLTDYFDTNTGLGKTMGYFGWQLHTILKNGRGPIGFGSVTENYSNNQPSETFNFNIGDANGSVKHQLTVDELPAHKFNTAWDGTGAPVSLDDRDKHDLPIATRNEGIENNYHYELVAPQDETQEANIGSTNTLGSNKPIDKMDPYYVVAFIKRLY